MSAAAHRGDHDIAFYEAAIEETRELAVSTVFAQLPDEDGPLRPGRYLVQFINPSSDTAVCWVHVGPFEKGETLDGTTGPGPRRVPLSRQSVIAIEYHVLEGYSDQLGAILTSGSAALYITRVSTEARARGIAGG